MLAKLFSCGKKWGVHAILGALFLAFILLALRIYSSVEQELTDVALTRRAAVAKLAAATLSERFARLLDVGVSLATRVRFRQLVAEGQWADAIEVLRDVPRDLPVINRVFLTDAAGTLMADVPELGGVRGQNFAHQDWFKGVSRGWRRYVSPVYTRAAASQPNVFAVAVPVPKEGGGVAGILVLQVQLDSTFFEWTKQIEIDPEGVVYIVDQNGQVAFHSKLPVRGEILDFSALPVVQQVRQGNEGVHIAADAMGKEETILAYASVESYGWSVVTQQPARAALGVLARDDQLRRLLVAYGLLLFLSVSMIYVAYRTVVQRRQANEDQRINSELERRVADRTAQLEAANKDLEAFAYSVSHDLRAPLRAIDGFSQALLEDYEAKLDEEGKDNLQRVRSAAQRMGHLIDDMLKLSRTTRSEMDVRTVDLSPIAESVVAELRRSEQERNVKVSIAPGVTVRGDGRLLEAVLVNLFSNAWKFTAKKDCGAIEFGAEKIGAELVCHVRDNGAGFDMAYAAKLFAPFQRLHRATEFLGNGIGLATVKRIIARHGGRVWAEGKVDRGATFFFALPDASTTKG